jgi:hypothetical protein
VIATCSSSVAKMADGVVTGRCAPSTDALWLTSLENKEGGVFNAKEKAFGL